MATGCKVDGVSIKTPTEFTEESFRLTKSNRLQDGKMSMEMIAKKKKFTLKYSILDSNELKVIEDLIWKPWNPYYTFSFNDDKGQHSYTVYSGDLSKSLYRIWNNGSYLYKDYELRLIEV